MSVFLEKFHSIFCKSKQLVIGGFWGAVLISTLFGCEPNKGKNPKPSINPENLAAKGSAEELEKVLEAALKSHGQIVFSSKECPQKVIELLPSKVHKSTECGAIKVPEDHRSDTSKFISLGYLKFPKKFDSQKPLLVIEQGGPGSSSMVLSSWYLSAVSQLSESFNILAIEQRGTNWTRPKATCDAMVDISIKIKEENLEDDEAERLVIKTNKKCLEEIKKNVNVSKFSSYQISKDLVFSANQFGFSKFSYFGVSYGTVVGQYLLKYSNRTLDKIVLDSPVVPGLSWMNDAVKNMDWVGKKNLEQFISSQTNDMSFEEGVRYIKDAVKKFKDNPVSIQAEFNGKKVKVDVDEKVFLGLLFKMLTVNYDEKSLKYLLWTSDNMTTRPEDVKTVLKIYVENFSNRNDDIFEIMYQSIVCREFPTHKNDILGATSNWTFFPSIIGKDNLSQLKEPIKCYLDIPNSDEDVTLSGPISSKKPILIIGGEIDHVTSPQYVENIAIDMPNSHRQVFKDVGHGVFTKKPCITESVVNYLLSENGSYINKCE